jgi:hypothetical protein
VKGLPFRYSVKIVVEQVGVDGARRELAIDGTVRSPVESDPGQFGLKALRRALHDCANQVAKRKARR